MENLVRARHYVIDSEDPAVPKWFSGTFTSLICNSVSSHTIHYLFLTCFLTYSKHLPPHKVSCQCFDPLIRTWSHDVSRKSEPGFSETDQIWKRGGLVAVLQLPLSHISALVCRYIKGNWQNVAGSHLKVMGPIVVVALLYHRISIQ